MQRSRFAAILGLSLFITIGTAMLAISPAHDPLDPPPDIITTVPTLTITNTHDGADINVWYTDPTPVPARGASVVIDLKPAAGGLFSVEVGQFDGGGTVALCWVDTSAGNIRNGLGELGDLIYADTTLARLNITVEFHATLDQYRIIAGGVTSSWYSTLVAIDTGIYAVCFRSVGTMIPAVTMVYSITVGTTTDDFSSLVVGNIDLQVGPLGTWHVCPTFLDQTAMVTSG